MARGTSPKQISENALFLGLRKSWHIHPCMNRDCRQVLECTGHMAPKGALAMTECTARENNLPCHDCAGVLGRPIWVAARDPQVCCYGNVRQVTYRNDLLANKLAGSWPWYMCRTCARSSAWPLGYNPETPTEMRIP